MSIGDMLQAEVDTEDAIRYRWILDHPDGARHLLHLLEQGKGDKKSFSKMIDRIIASERMAYERGRSENSACRTCRGTATISYVDTDGSTKNEQCPDCTTLSASSTP